jgi:DNA-binding PucR family transcriptional regulator
MASGPTRPYRPEAARTPGGVQVYDELGISRVLPAGTSRREAELFVRHWLAPVVNYDAERGTELVMTLSTYLNHGGDLVPAAAELSRTVHRTDVRSRRRAETGVLGVGGHAAVSSSSSLAAP